MTRLVVHICHGQSALDRSFCTRLSSIFCLKDPGPGRSRSILAMTNVHDHCEIVKYGFIYCGLTMTLTELNIFHRECFMYTVVWCKYFVWKVLLCSGLNMLYGKYCRVPPPIGLKYGFIYYGLTMTELNIFYRECFMYTVVWCKYFVWKILQSIMIYHHQAIIDDTQIQLSV